MEKMTKQKLGKYDGSGSNFAVPSAETHYSQAVNISYAKSFCLSVRAVVSSGTPDVDLYVEQSHLPDAVDTDAAGTGGNAFAQIEGAAKILDITDTNWHHLTISPAALSKLRLKAIGQGANPASCALEAYLTAMEQIY